MGIEPAIIAFLDADVEARRRCASAVGSAARLRLQAIRSAHANPTAHPLILHTSRVLTDVSSAWLLEPVRTLTGEPYRLFEGLRPDDGHSIAQLRGRVAGLLDMCESCVALHAFLQRFDDAPGLDGRTAISRLTASYTAAIGWATSIVDFISDADANEDVLAEPPTQADFEELVGLAHRRRECNPEDALAAAFGAQASEVRGGLHRAVAAGVLPFDQIRARLSDGAAVYAPDANALYARNAIMFAERLVLSPYPLRAAWAEQEFARIVAEAFSADPPAALAIISDHAEFAPAGVLETARRIEGDLRQGDYLAANRLLAEGVLRPMAVRTLALDALATGQPLVGLTSTSDLPDFETALTASPEPVHRQLGEHISRAVRNADAHAGAHHLIDGSVRLSTRDGDETVTPIGLEMAYWQLRSMLDGLDTALEAAVIVEVGLHRPEGVMPRITTVGQSLVVTRWIADDYGLRVVSVEHEGTSAIITVTGAQPSQDELGRLAVAIERVFEWGLSPLEIVHQTDGWVYRYRRDS